MSIAVTCGCGKRLTVADEFAGRSGKCPACGQVLQIPTAVPAEPKPNVLHALQSQKPAGEPKPQQIPNMAGYPPMAPAPLGESPFRAGPPGNFNPYAPQAYPGHGFGPPGPP